MARKKIEEQSGPGIVVLYTSLMILLLAFFILLNSMSKVEEAKVEAAFNSLMGTFGFQPGGLNVIRPELFGKSTSMAPPVNPVDQDYIFLRGILKEKKMLGEIKLLRSETVRTVVIPAVLLFEPDSTKLSPKGRDFLAQVAAIIKNRNYPVTLNGYTDDAPARATGRKNNWYISAERALSVLLFLIQNGVKPDRLAAFGLAGFRPMVPNTNPQNRRAQQPGGNGDGFQGHQPPPAARGGKGDGSWTFGGSHSTCWAKSRGPGMARKEKEEASFDPLGWMFTFSDLVTLLLTFFVMLLAMKQPEIQKLRAAFSIFIEGSTSSMSLSDKSEVQKFQHLLNSLRQPTIDDLTSEKQKLAAKLDLPPSQETRLLHRLQENVSLRREERGVVITLANDLMFASGEAKLSEKAKEAIHQVAAMLRYGDVPISVEGHTDNLATDPRSGFANNWQLSLARAMAVLDQLVKAEKIRASRVRVAALGDTRPLVPNDTPEHRAMNRRTEIVLLTPQP